MILSIVIYFTAIVATAQMNAPRYSANYEAANWKTWMLDNPEQITVVSPPDV